MTTATVPLRLEIHRGWIGQNEVPGKGANPIIAGTPTSWFSLLGFPEIKSDEIANCAAAVGASLVLETFCAAGWTLKELKSADPDEREAAAEALAWAKANTPLPIRDRRLLARGYADIGIDARHDPKPGDIIVIPRGKAWEGHVMQIDEVQSSLRRYKCVGSNQGDSTNYAYLSFDADIVAIRRPVPATAKDLRAAGSGAIARGEAIKTIGDGLAVGTPIVTATAKIAEKVAEAPSLIPDDPPAALDSMKTAAESLGILNTLMDAAAATGAFLVERPWIVVLVATGIVLRVYGLQEIRKRVASYARGVPLSNPKPA